MEWCKWGHILTRYVQNRQTDNEKSMCRRTKRKNSLLSIRKSVLQVFVFDTLAFSVFSFALSPVTKHDLPYSEGSAQPAKASAQSTRGRQEQLAARTWQTLSADACGHNILFPVCAFPFPGISKARSHLIATVCFSIQCVAFYCLDNVL
jgi:hypothetical protein